MNKIILLTFIFAFFVLPLLAQEQEEAQKQAPEIPVGMEVIQDGTIKHIVPQDSQRRIERNLTVVESTEAYISRRVMELEERVVALEAREKELLAKIEQLQDALREIKGE